MLNKNSCISRLSRLTEQPLRRHSVLDTESRRYNRETLKPIYQTPDYNLPGRSQVEKAAVQGDGMEEALNKDTFRAPLRSGFTLIELLVVVLIIGILASIALPQYQKAVKKTKLAELSVMVDAAKKNIELYVLQNGSNGPIILTSPEGRGDLSFDVPGTCDDEGFCTIKAGRVQFGCGGPCDINYDSGDWLHNVSFMLRREANSKKWAVGKIGGGQPEDLAIVCQWIKGNGYPAYSDTVSACAEVGVSLNTYP